MKFWLDNDYNVLFVGHAGVGKTTIILDAWKQANLKKAASLF
jgi:MoxR-like ATPase